MGNGMAWSVVTTDDAGKPLTLGVEFGPEALEGLPSGHAHPTEYVLQLPDEVAVPPFDHLTLDWNEHGHEPANVYDKPHFDVHFYFMSAAERDLIGPNDTTAFNKPLPGENLPPDYLETPGGVPRMGAHVIDLRSPEVNGSGTFTHTFIFGKYDAELNFLEPMVTTEFLLGKPMVTAEVRQPAAWQESGYYPTTYTIDYDESNDLYSVALEGLVWHE